MKWGGQSKAEIPDEASWYIQNRALSRRRWSRAGDLTAIWRDLPANGIMQRFGV